MSVIADNFGKKGEAIIEANRRVAQAAFEQARNGMAHYAAGR